MKRNLDLIRNILFRMEEMPARGKFNFEFDGFNRDQVMYHIYLLKDANFIEAYDASSMQNIHYNPTKITWAGQEFLDNARNDTIWSNAKNKMKEAAISVSIAVFSQLLVQMATIQLGLK